VGGDMDDNAATTTWWRIADWLLEFPTSFLALIRLYPENTLVTKEDVLHKWSNSCSYHRKKTPEDQLAAKPNILTKFYTTHKPHKQ